MLNWLWSVLNLLLFLSILYILFRATKLVKQHIGSGSALFFVFSLVVISTRGSTKQDEVAKNLLSNTSKHGPLANAGAERTIDLGGSNKLVLLAEYDINNDALTPHGLYASVSGILLGHRWEPVLGMLQQQGNQLHYFVVLSHHWLLLGIPILTQAGGEFEGVMLPNKRL